MKKIFIDLAMSTETGIMLIDNDVLDANGLETIRYKKVVFSPSPYDVNQAISTIESLNFKNIFIELFTDADFQVYLPETKVFIETVDESTFGGYGKKGAKIEWVELQNLVETKLYQWGVKRENTLRIAPNEWRTKMRRILGIPSDDYLEQHVVWGLTKDSDPIRYNEIMNNSSSYISFPTLNAEHDKYGIWPIPPTGHTKNLVLYNQWFTKGFKTSKILSILAYVYSRYLDYAKIGSLREDYFDCFAMWRADKELTLIGKDLYNQNCRLQRYKKRAASVEERAKKKAAKAQAEMLEFHKYFEISNNMDGDTESDYGDRIFNLTISPKREALVLDKESKIYLKQREIWKQQKKLKEFDKRAPNDIEFLKLSVNARKCFDKTLAKLLIKPEGGVEVTESASTLSNIPASGIKE